MSKSAERPQQNGEAVPQARFGDHAQVDPHTARYVESEVAHQLESLNLTKKMVQEISAFQKNLKLHHKIAYGTMVFLGVLLMWYGTWGAVASIPVLKEPAVALAAGISLLALIGVLYSKLTA